MADEIPPDPESPASRRLLWLPPVLLVTLVAFAPAVWGDFTFVDRDVALGHDGEHGNPGVAELLPLPDYFTSHGEPYRPVTTLSFALRHTAVGDSAPVAHAINVLLHVLATALVYGLLRGLRASPRVAALGALFFGLHAIHSEAVATVSGRSELLAFCGGAGGLLLLVRGRGLSPLARSVTLLGAAALLFVGLGAAETAVAWIPVAACYGLARRWAAGGGPRWLALLPEAVALLLPLLAILYLRSVALADVPSGAVGAEYAANPIFDAPGQTRVLTGVLVWGYGLWLTLAPLSLSADYGVAVFPIVERFDQPATLLTILAALALAALALAGLWRAHRRPLLFWGVACFFGFGVLTSNLAFPAGNIFSERSYYAPGLLVACGAAWLAGRLRAGQVPLALMLAGAWLGASAWTAIDRTGVWRDDESLIFREIETQPSAVRMRVRAARILAERGEARAATRQLEHAVVLEPAHAPAWVSLGDLNAAAGRTEQAIACYREALKAEPGSAAQEVIEGKLEPLVNDRTRPLSRPPSSR